MPLNEQQIREILKQPTKKAVIQRAVDHQERIKFHCEVALTRATTSQKVTEFLEWVRNRIPADKFAIFQSLFRYPVKSVKLTKKIREDLSKLFDGQNPVYRTDFMIPEHEEDWHDYRKNVLEAPDKWRTDGIETMMLAINSFIIVDLPAEQKGTLPEPYWYFLDIGNVIDWDETDDNLDWIVFRQSPTEIVVIDDTSYRVFRTKEKDNTKFEALISEAPHDLTYCPAHWFWSERISITDPDMKLSPVTTELPDLDWYLFYAISKQAMDQTGSWPIMAMYEPNCDFEQETKEGYHRCDHGFLRDQNNRYMMLSDGTIMRCPACKEKSLAGAGTVFHLPAPVPGQPGGDMMKNPVQIITVPVESLEAVTKECDRLRYQIREDVTGYSGEPINDEAVNEKQVRAIFESRTAILRDRKKNFEIAIEWTDFTIAKLRYGQSFISCSVDLGTDFYLYDAASILEIYNAARLAEVDSIILDRIQDQYFASKYRNNPDEMRRVTILKHLEPLRHVTTSRATEFYKIQSITYKEWYFKINFSNFVLRFEREQASLLKFGENLDFDKKIEKIREIMESYIPEKPEQKNISNGKESSIIPASAN